MVVDCSLLDRRDDAGRRCDVGEDVFSKGDLGGPIPVSPTVNFFPHSQRALFLAEIHGRDRSDLSEIGYLIRVVRRFDAGSRKGRFGR